VNFNPSLPTPAREGEMATHPKLAKTGLQRQEGGSVKDKGKRIKDKLLLAVFVLLTMVGIEATAEAQNCPLDWHPPPCGNPPEPVKKEKKRAAEMARNYHTSAIWFFTTWSSVACGADKLGYKPAKAACVAGGMGLSAAAAAAVREDRIASDPFDPQYQELYTGRWLSYDDLGLTGWLELAGDGPGVGAFWNMAEHMQAAEMLGDRVAVSFDRAMSCYSAGIELRYYLGCEHWQSQWTDDNLRWLGERYVALANSFRWAAQELTPYIGDGVNPELVNDLYIEAAWLEWAGWEFQQ
jgi:hypothetical protein